MMAMVRRAAALMVLLLLLHVQRWMGKNRNWLKIRLKMKKTIQRIQRLLLAHGTKLY